MAAVYVSNLVINVGSDFSQSFVLQGPDNANLDLTDYTAESKMRKWSGSSTAISFDVGFGLDPTEGKVLIALDASITSTLKPGRYIYDTVITSLLDGTKNRVIEGTVLVREGATY